MSLLVLFGRNVRAARKKIGLSQERLAFEAEMKRSYLSDLERGARNPSLKAVERIAIALKTEPWLLFVESADPDHSKKC